MSGAITDIAPVTVEAPPDILTLSADGKDHVGWQDIRVTRRLEGVPGDFEVRITEQFPRQTTRTTVIPGQPCTVKIASDSVVTGYVDRYLSSFSPRAHVVRVQGRGKCQDLVDCSITTDILNGMEIVTSSLIELATRLCTPYGIKVKSLTGNNVPVSTPLSDAPLRFNANLTQTPYEIIEEVARYAGVLVYEDQDGGLVIANVGGDGTHSSGFAQGVNVEAASVSIAVDGRYSEYFPVLMSTNFYGQDGVGGISYPKVHDTGVKRFRQLIVVSEQPFPGSSMAEKRAQWEAARRRGRSESVRVTCDSWRDSKGRLWSPNALAPVYLPALKMTPKEPLVVSEVTFSLDAKGGTRADLTLMAKEAFVPEPTILTPYLWDPNAKPPPATGASDPTGGAPT